MITITTDDGSEIRRSLGGHYGASASQSSHLRSKPFFALNYFLWYLHPQTIFTYFVFSPPILFQFFVPLHLNLQSSKETDTHPPSLHTPYTYRCEKCKTYCIKLLQDFLKARWVKILKAIFLSKFQDTITLSNSQQLSRWAWNNCKITLKENEFLGVVTIYITTTYYLIHNQCDSSIPQNLFCSTHCCFCYITHWFCELKIQTLTV